jgi:hypothetical protein
VEKPQAYRGALFEPESGYLLLLVPRYLEGASRRTGEERENGVHIRHGIMQSAVASEFEKVPGLTEFN